MSPERSPRRLAPLVVAIALVAGACTSSSSSVPQLRAPGPPRVRPEVVARHALQFDDELSRRPAGSQEEEAAAAYILGHLQQAGYAARLEAVPVADTVSSTDVIALPPGNVGPATVVAVAYDTGEPPRPTGTSIGFFLELARALAVASPEHSVEFVGLGAEHTSVGGGHLGSRRLVQLLVDQGQAPLVVTIEAIGGKAEAGFGAFGQDTAALREVAARLDAPFLPLPPPDPDVGRELTARGRIYTEARLEHVGVVGGVEETGRVLLAYLSP